MTDTRLRRSAEEIYAAELAALAPDAAPRAALLAELLAILSQGPTRP